MLIRGADVWRHGEADVRLADGRVQEIGRLTPMPGEPVIDAQGGALLPGLHDHHVHLAGLAARAASVVCGPPEVVTAEDLARRLRRPGQGWLRGVGYHESVMGLPDARALDALVADRPVRIQHRSGRMWLLNSLALDLLLRAADPPPGLERDAVGFTGRLFDEDRWLQAALGGVPPDFAEISQTLSSYGVTGITDMSPANDPGIAAHVARQIDQGRLRQRCWLAGSLALADAPQARWRLGPAKLHLHEAALPEFDQAMAFIAAAHAQSRAVAIHCVSEVELVFALAALEAAGAAPGDRIEHASIASPDLARHMAELGLIVVTQPHFVAERGDRYLADVEPRHIPDLYRLRSLIDAGIPLAGGSDAPFASADPWIAMTAATTRVTHGGQTIGAAEALSPEQAIGLFLGDPQDLRRERVIAPDEPADLCLLSCAWTEARMRLTSADVRAAWVGGRVIDDFIDQPPG